MKIKSKSQGDLFQKQYLPLSEGIKNWIMRFMCLSEKILSEVKNTQNKTCRLYNYRQPS